jgi:hypothetical protein
MTGEIGGPLVPGPRAARPRPGVSPTQQLTVPRLGRSRYILFLESLLFAHYAPLSRAVMVSFHTCVD